MIPGRFRFDSTKHRYYMIGARHRYQLPGISSLLRAGGYVDERRYTEVGRERGSLVHEMIEAILLDAIDVDKLRDTKISGYVKAAVEFMHRVHPTVDDVEGCAVNRRLGFATKIDVLGTFAGEPGVLNWKTGEAKRADEIQSALEVLAVDGKWGGRRRFVCYLKKNGKYAFREHLNDGDYAAAGEAIDLWRSNHHNPTIHPPLRLLEPVATALQ